MRHSRRRPADESIEALLRDVASLRLTLDTDLTVAAAAAEADRLDLAAEIVDFDRAELAAFADSAAGRLVQPEPARELVDATVEAPAKQRMPWRQRVALTAAPAMLAATAIIAVVGVSGGSSGPARNAAAPPQLVASYSALTELARSNRDPAELFAVGSALNRSLAQLVSEAAHDPAKAQQAMRILQAETQLLTIHHPNGGDRLLAQAAALVRRLRETVPLSVFGTTASTAGPSAPPIVTALLPTAAASASPAPAATTTRAPRESTTTAPPPQSTAPTPEPTSGDVTVSPEPSPQPSAIDPWPFGGAGHAGN